MEGIKERAIAYYERATEEEKETAREYFKRLDQNGDGKVILLEFKKSVCSWLSSEKAFKQLDANGEGTLDFHEVLAIYYMEKGKLSLCCHGCRDLLRGQFFSCFRCLPKYPNSVDLCCDCYREGKFKHEHSISNFIDHSSLLKWFMSRRGNEERTQEKVEGMEQLGTSMGDINMSKSGALESNPNQEITEHEKVKMPSKTDILVQALHRRDVVTIQKVLLMDNIADLMIREEPPHHETPTGTSCQIEEQEIQRARRTNRTKEPEGSSFIQNQSEMEELHEIARHREMEELREIAKAHYEAGSLKVQALAKEFFKSMDSDGDGRIDLPEFLAFTRQEGHDQMNKNFFKKYLDRDGNGTLDFWEVMTLYYIIKSGRPFCNFCKKFVPGIFFSCVGCSFTLCRNCYRSNRNHDHNGRTQFLDNYTLLQAKQDSSQATPINPNPPNISYYVNHSTAPSTAIVPAHKVNKWDVAFKAFEVALAIGSISSTLCTIL